MRCMRRSSPLRMSIRSAHRATSCCRNSAVAARGAEKVALANLMRQADFVSINCPLTKETRGMIGAREFSLMQPHAFFITTARGHIHDEAALAEVLRARKIAGAGLDVWAKE